MKEITQLKNISLVTYDKTLQQITVKLPKTPLEWGFNTDNIYWFQADDKRYFDLNKLFLRVSVIRYWWETDQGNPWTANSTIDMSKAPNFPTHARLKIEAIYYSENKAKSGSKLNGFSRVIDDNNYFSVIPLINELTHFDNGVITSNDYKMSYLFDDNSTIKHDNEKENIHYESLVNWSDFKLSAVNLYDGAGRLTMTALEGHRKL